MRNLFRVCKWEKRGFVPALRAAAARALDMAAVEEAAATAAEVGATAAAIRGTRKVMAVGRVVVGTTRIVRIDLPSGAKQRRAPIWGRPR